MAIWLEGYMVKGLKGFEGVITFKIEEIKWGCPICLGSFFFFPRFL